MLFRLFICCSILYLQNATVRPGYGTKKQFYFLQSNPTTLFDVFRNSFNVDGKTDNSLKRSPILDGLVSSS